MTHSKEVAQAVYNLLSRSKDPQKLAESIAAYLLDAKRSKDAAALLRDLEALRLEQDDILEVNVTSARPLSETTKKNIKTLFDAQKVIINEEQDSTLIGGVKVRAHDVQLDTSVRTRLQRMKAGV